MRPTIPEHIGKLVKKGVLITHQSHICSDHINVFNYFENGRTKLGWLLRVCETILGGPVKNSEADTRHRIMGRPPSYRKALQFADAYMVVPDTFAQIIIQYEKHPDYAGMSLQEFILRTWTGS